MALITGRKLLAVVLSMAMLLASCGGKEERKAKYLERGKAYLAEENWDKARIEIKNVLQIDPKSAEAYYLMGQVEEKRQEWSKAYGNYSKAVELDPGLVDARARLAQFYLLQANVFKSQDDREGEAKALGQAQQAIDDVLNKQPTSVAGRTLQASMLQREGKVDEAISLLESVVKDDPSYGPAAGLLASLYELAGRSSDAEKLLIRSIETAKESIPLKLHLAQLYVREKKSADAEAMLRNVIELRPDDIAHRVRLAQLFVQSDQNDKAKAVMREAIEHDPSDAQRYLMLADLLIAKESDESARAFLIDSIAKKPEMYELRLGLARLYEQKNQTQQASKVYEEMIARYGDEPAGLVARNHLAVQAAEAKDYDNAAKLVSEVLQQNPKDNDALIMKGRLAMQKLDYDEAVTAFRSVLKDQPSSVAILHLLAEAQLRKGDVELAGDNLRRAVEVAPQNVDARIKLARYLMAKKDLPGALELIDAVLAKDAGNVDALAAKSELLAAKGDLAAVKQELAKLKEASPDSPEASLRLARVLMSEGNMDGAMAELDVVLAKDDKNVQALVMKTEVLAVNKDIDGLKSVIKQLKLVAPNNPEGYFRMGRLLRAQGDSEAALKEYEQGYSLAVGVGKVALLSEIVNTQLAAGQHDQALARLEAVQRDEPEHRTVNELIGMVQMARKEYAAAELAFVKQLETSPNSATIYTQVAAARELQGNKEGAVAILNQGLSVLKDDASLRLALASSYERQGQPDAAMEQYEAVLAKQPNNAMAVNNLAALLVDYRSDERSLKRAKELATMLEPIQQPAIRDTIGWVYYKTGNYEKSIEVLGAVVTASPNIAIFHYHLGMAYAKSGDKAKAKTHLAKALELGDFLGAEEARTTLASL